MNVIELSQLNFVTEVIGTTKPVLVDFSATWCGPCKMVAPILEELAEEQDEVKICKVDVDKSPELARKFAVMSVPTLILVKDGSVLKQSVGAISKQEALDFIKI